jgi:hypothetical protein
MPVKKTLLAIVLASVHICLAVAQTPLPEGGRAAYAIEWAGGIDELFLSPGHSDDQAPACLFSSGGSLYHARMPSPENSGTGLPLASPKSLSLEGILPSSLRSLFCARRFADEWILLFVAKGTEGQESLYRASIKEGIPSTPHPIPLPPAPGRIDEYQAAIGDFGQVWIALSRQGRLYAVSIRDGFMGESVSALSLDPTSDGSAPRSPAFSLQALPGAGSAEILILEYAYQGQGLFSSITIDAGGIGPQASLAGLFSSFKVLSRDASGRADRVFLEEAAGGILAEVREGSWHRALSLEKGQAPAYRMRDSNFYVLGSGGRGGPSIGILDTAGGALHELDCMIGADTASLRLCAQGVGSERLSLRACAVGQSGAWIERRLELAMGDGGPRLLSLERESIASDFEPAYYARPGSCLRLDLGRGRARLDMDGVSSSEGSVLGASSVIEASSVIGASIPFPARVLAGGLIYESANAKGDVALLALPAGRGFLAARSLSAEAGPEWACVLKDGDRWIVSMSEGGR